MFVFILDSLLVLFSIYLIIRNYRFIKDEEKSIEDRISKYIFGSISLLGIGILLAGASIIASRKYDVNIDTLFLIITILIAIIVYISLIILWNKMYSYLKINVSKKIPVNYSFKLKSITIYGLVYSFGILFYLLYLIVIFF